MRTTHVGLLDLFSRYGPLADYEVSSLLSLDVETARRLRRELQRPGLLQQSKDQRVSPQGVSVRCYELTPMGLAAWKAAVL